MTVGSELWASNKDRDKGVGCSATGSVGGKKTGTELGREVK